MARKLPTATTTTAANANAKMYAVIIKIATTKHHTMQTDIATATAAVAGRLTVPPNVGNATIQCEYNQIA